MFLFLAENSGQPEMVLFLTKDYSLVESTGKHEVNHAARYFKSRNQREIDLFRAALKTAE